MKPRPISHYHYALDHHDMLYGPAERTEFAALLTVAPGVRSLEEMRAGSAGLGEAEVLLAGWGAEPLTAVVLDRLPRLRAVFYAGGSVKGLVADGELFRRGVRLSSSNPALAESVAEFALAQILLANKRVWRDAAEVQRLRTYPPRIPGPGNYGSTVALLGYGAIARALRRLLRPFALHVIVYDPYLSPEAARAEDVEVVSLEAAFQRGDVVSCHLPKLPATLGLLSAVHFRSMKPGATFLNTARGEVVQEEALAAVLRERPDLWALLDVVEKEPISPTHPFIDLPNVTITPHIAGSMGAECRRFGGFLLAEVRHWLADEPLAGEIRAEQLPFLA